MAEKQTDDKNGKKATPKKASPKKAKVMSEEELDERAVMRSSYNSGAQANTRHDGDYDYAREG